MLTPDHAEELLNIELSRIERESYSRPNWSGSGSVATRAHNVARVMAVMQEKEYAYADDIAKATDLSVRTIYRAVKALREYGYPIDGQPGAGYRWRGPR